MNQLPAPRPSLLPPALESLSPLQGVVIKAADLMLPRATKLTTTQSLGEFSFTFTAYLELTTNNIFVKPGDFEYANAGTIFDKSVLYVAQPNVQASYYRSYRELGACVFASLTAWLNHVRCHLSFLKFMKENDVDMATMRTALARREPKPRKGKVQRDPSLPWPAPSNPGKVLVNGIHFAHGRIRGTDDSVRAHPDGVTGDVSITKFYEMFERLAHEAKITLFAAKEGVGRRLFPSQITVATKRKARAIVPRVEAVAAATALVSLDGSTMTTTTAAQTSNTIIQVGSATTIDDEALSPVAPTKRRRVARKPKPFELVPPPVSTTMTTEQKAADDDIDDGETVLMSGKVTTKLVRSMGDASGFLPHNITVGAAGLIKPSFDSLADLRDKLLPKLKPAPGSPPLSPSRSLTTLVTTSALVKESGKQAAAQSSGGADWRPTRDGHMLRVPLPELEPGMAHTLTEGVVHGRWPASGKLRTLLENQPALWSEVAAGFKSRSKQFLVIACTAQPDDMQRLLDAVGTHELERAVFAGVARGWTMLVKTGGVPETLPYRAYELAVDDARRYERAAPHIRRIGQRFLVQGATEPVVGWGVQATAAFAKGDVVCKYSGRRVHGGLTELSAEQAVYELAGYSLAEAEDVYSFTEHRRNGEQRVLSARGKPYFGCLAAYINCCGPARKELVNVEFYKGTATLCATRAIEAGEMLCLDYGIDYYKRMQDAGTPIGVPGDADELLPMPLELPVATRNTAALAACLAPSRPMTPSPEADDSPAAAAEPASTSMLSDLDGALLFGELPASTGDVHPGIERLFDLVARGEADYIFADDVPAFAFGKVNDDLVSAPPSLATSTTTSAANNNMSELNLSSDDVLEEFGFNNNTDIVAPEPQLRSFWSPAPQFDSFEL